MREDVPETMTLRKSSYIARRDYRCDCCGRTLPKGRAYRYLAYLDMEQTPPKFETMKMHFWCEVGDEE